MKRFIITFIVLLLILLLIILYALFLDKPSFRSKVKVEDNVPEAFGELMISDLEKGGYELDVIDKVSIAYIGETSCSNIANGKVYEVSIKSQIAGKAVRRYVTNSSGDLKLCLVNNGPEETLKIVD